MKFNLHSRTKSSPNLKSGFMLTTELIYNDFVMQNAREAVRALPGIN